MNKFQMPKGQPPPPKRINTNLNGTPTQNPTNQVVHVPSKLPPPTAPLTTPPPAFASSNMSYSSTTPKVLTADGTAYLSPAHNTNTSKTSKTTPYGLINTGDMNTPQRSLSINTKDVEDDSDDEPEDTVLAAAHI